MAAPSTPTNLFSQVANGQVLLTFDISAGATSYNIYRSADNVTFSNIASPAINNYLDTSVTINTQYYYKVTAVNTDGESNLTSAVDAIPTMEGIESLASLRLQAQQKADRVNSNFVTTAEWNKYLNQSAKELYDLLITVYEDYYLAQPYVFQTDGSNEYALPDGTQTDINNVQTQSFYKLMGIDLGIANNNNAKVTVHKFDFIERNRYVYPNITSTFLGVFNMRYRIMGSKIRFIPTPSSGQYITMWYIPRLPSMLKDTDTLDAISGWSEYVIIDAAIKALQKEESDVSAFMAEKMALKQRIEETATNRDAGMPDTISNTRAFNSRGGNGSWGFDGSSGGY
jgi:hypothetical protein